MDPTQACETVRTNQKYLANTLSVFQAEHGSFRPVEDMMTVAQQIRHIALSTDWFRKGAFGEGFSMDFEAMEREMFRDVTLEEALAELEGSSQRLISQLEAATAEELDAPMPENPIFGPLPRHVILFANGDHMAHHRGSLAVYARLLGLKPPMVYS